MRKSILMLVLISLSAITACGGGGGGGTPPVAQQAVAAVLTLSLSGSLPADTLVGGIEVTVTLPEGVTVTATPDSENPDKLIVSNASLSASSAQMIVGTFIPASGADTARVRIFVASDSGFGTGEFAHLTCSLNNTSPAHSGFKIEGDSFIVYGINSATNSTPDLTSALTPEVTAVFQ